MITVKLGTRGEDVGLLSELLGLPRVTVASEDLIQAVKDFQSVSGLVSDGIAGWKTWKALIIAVQERQRPGKEWEFKMLAGLIGVEPEVLMAVQKVETGGLGGFLKESGRPRILFEGHVFWKYLVQEKKDPNKYLPRYSDVLYKKWTKSMYVGGEGEWTRLEKAMEISESSAIMSASWGMFQIMGGNYSLCGCKDVWEFKELMEKDEFSQMILAVEFIKNRKLVPALVSKRWAEFAKGYNGAEYYKNNYDTKLKSAYLSFKKR